MARDLQITRGLLLVLLLITNSGCGFTPPAPQETVPVADIINSIICGVSASVAEEKAEQALDPSRPILLSGQTATVFLDLKTVDTTNLSIGVGGPGSPSGTTSGSAKSQSSVVSYKGLGGWIPSLTASDATTWTVDSQINLPFQLDGFNSAACAAANLDLQPDRYGFSKWLSDTLVSTSRVTNIGSVTDRKLIYDSNFGVTTGGGGGISGVLSFIPVSANASLSRNDVQHLKVTLAKQAASIPAPTPGAGSAQVYAPSIKDVMAAKTPHAVPVSRVRPME
jgi:hypothetical protein